MFDDAVAREARRRGDLLPERTVSALAEDSAVAGVPVRVFTPPNPRGAFLHVHGGGFVYGSSRFQDDRLERLATACDRVVCSVEYRLAPEHPYPAAVDDCEAVASRLIDEFGWCAIGGESAGANLAVVTLLRLRDRRGATGFRAAALTAGLYDLTLAQVDDCDPELTRAELESLVTHYAGGASLADPELSPLFADLAGLPPALIAVGEHDPLLADSTRLAERWEGATLEVVDGAQHSMDPGELVHAFLREL